MVYPIFELSHFIAKMLQITEGFSDGNDDKKKNDLP